MNYRTVLSSLILILRFIFKQSDICIAITTTKSYSDFTLHKLLRQLRNHRIRLNKIYVFEGGYFENLKLNKKYNHFIVDHNTFDLTALISILDLKLKSRNWLLLHDTIELDKSFWKRFYGIRMNNYDCMPLRDHPSMNIGVYSLDYLIKNRIYLLSLKNIDYSYEGLQKVKAKGVIDEDYLFLNSKNKLFINEHLKNKEVCTQVYYMGKVRNKEYYPQLGIIKYKANFMLSNYYDIEL